jgi:hypothetical protein
MKIPSPVKKPEIPNLNLAITAMDKTFGIVKQKSLKPKG